MHIARQARQEQQFAACAAILAFGRVQAELASEWEADLTKPAR